MNSVVAHQRSIVPKLFTIGYEGRTLPDYLSILQANGIRVVVDVRKNPLSRKRGFSKRALCEALAESGIAYVHIPELGIDSSLRQNLQTSEDYDKLFAFYEQESLPKSTDAIERIEGILQRYGAVALTCFERDAGHCHRHCVSDMLARQAAPLRQTVHL